MSYNPDHVFFCNTSAIHNLPIDAMHTTGAAPEKLVVIDTITFSTSDAAGVDASISILDSNSAIIWEGFTTLAAAEVGTIHATFPGGLPCWIMVASGATYKSGSMPSGTVSVQATFGTGTASCTITYHYESPSMRR